MPAFEDLTATAIATLGAERAAALAVELEERGRQIDQVLSAPDGGAPTTAVGEVRPSTASVVAAARALECVQRMDPHLRAWAFVPGDPHRSTRVDPVAGRLDGVAVGVKDVIDVAGMPTRAGSPLTPAEAVAVDAPVVARVRAARAAIVGKTACTEWALNDPAPTRNPWNPALTPGGSSAGSAVAVATGMCAATVDTQTAGDVLRPAAFNGVVGLKPTIGWTSVAGTRMVAPTIDTIGVMACDVDTAAAVAAAVTDRPDRLRAWHPPAHPRLGVLADPFLETDEMLRRQLSTAVAAWRAVGAIVEEITSPVDLTALHAAHRVITFSECAAIHHDTFRRRPDDYGRRARAVVELGLLTPAHAYARAQQVRALATQALDDLFHRFDAVVAPVTPGPPPAADTTGDSRLQIPWTLCGFPAVSIPIGTVEALPAAAQLVGALHADERLIGTARWCADAVGPARPPSVGAPLTERRT